MRIVMYRDLGVKRLKLRPPLIFSVVPLNASGDRSRSLPESSKITEVVTEYDHADPPSIHSVSQKSVLDHFQNYVFTY